MGFYQQISKYYDYIFPVGKEQLELIRGSAGLPPKNILDVACGSGGYSLELGMGGYIVAAADLDNSMVKLAQEKAAANGDAFTAVRCDMLNLTQTFDNVYDLVFCIGNSLVHLGSTDQIKEAVSQMKNLLRGQGKVLLQIINFDRVVKYGINELPLLKNSNPDLVFERKYRLLENGRIGFDTVLTVGGEKVVERYANSIELLPLLSKDLLGILQECGFTDIKFYGDFSLSPYNDHSFLLVALAQI